MSMSEETKNNIAKWVFNGLLILVGIACFAFVASIGWYAFVGKPTLEERKAIKYEKEPVIQCVCVDGIKYVALFGDPANVTVKIDPETLQPERCSDEESE